MLNVMDWRLTDTILHCSVSHSVTRKLLDYHLNAIGVRLASRSPLCRLQWTKCAGGVLLTRFTYYTCVRRSICVFILIHDSCTGLFQSIYYHRIWNSESNASVMKRKPWVNACVDAMPLWSLVAELSCIECLDVEAASREPIERFCRGRQPAQLLWKGQRHCRMTAKFDTFVFFLWQY